MKTTNFIFWIKKYFTITCCLLLLGCGESFNAEDLEEKYTDSHSKFMLLDGNRIHYRDEGLGDVIVLIHGTASSLHTWDRWAEQLKKEYRVIRMDLPGFGLTGPEHAGRYEVSDDVQFLNSFFQKIGIEEAHLVGSSLGGRIVWQFAVDHQDRVSSITLMNSLGYPQESWPPPIEMAQWPVVDEIMKHFSPRFMYEIVLKDVYHDEALVNTVLVDRYFELSRYPGNLSAFPDRVKARLDKDANLISRIQVPTLVLWGEEDKYFPVENAYRFKKDIPNAQLSIYENVGHLPMEEVPEESLRDFLGFIAKSRLDFRKDLTTTNRSTY